MNKIYFEEKIPLITYQESKSCDDPEIDDGPQQLLPYYQSMME